MKRMATLIAAIAVIGVPSAHAQNHGEVGAYIDYFRLTSSNTNFAGIGGRASLNVTKHMQLEAEINYDFNEVFTERFTNPSTRVITSERSNIRVLHGLFGPKIQTGGGHFRAFATVKGGFANFRFDPRAATFNTFASSVDDLRANNVSAALYPGVGGEAYLGPIGLRLDVGDEIYFNNGTHHNWRASFGPNIRF
jgi:hypothetical protein